MKKILAWWLLIGGFTASAGVNVYNLNGSPNGGELTARRVQMIPVSPQLCCGLVNSVELTADQRQRFLECCPDYSRRCAGFETQVTSLILELDKQLFAQDADKQALYALADDIGELQTEQIKSRIDNILLVRRTLTRDQLERLKKCCGQK